jgi:hypothetical protein
VYRKDAKTSVEGLGYDCGSGLYMNIYINRPEVEPHIILGVARC